MTHRLAFLSVSFVLLIGCDSVIPPLDDIDDKVAEIRPGAFGLAHATGPVAGKNAEIYDGARLASSFDLGPIDNTQAFYFILINTGDTDITEISLQSSNDAFLIVPSQVERLSSEQVFSPLIAVTAVHGTAVSRLGPASLMPAGSNTTSLMVSGTTTDADGDSLAVSITAELRLYARVADIALFDQNGEIDLAKRQMTVTGLSAPGTIPAHFTARGPHHLINSGNVELGVSGIVEGGVQFEHRVAPGDSVAFVRTAQVFVLRLDTGAVITDIRRLPIASDGLVYFALINPITHPSPQ